jgi:hypothetical protein
VNVCKPWLFPHFPSVELARRTRLVRRNQFSSQQILNAADDLECVANWYAKTQLPPCVETWIADITKQQKAIARRKKKLTQPIVQNN